MLNWMVRLKGSGEAPVRVGTETYTVMPTVGPFVEIRNPEGESRRITLIEATAGVHDLSTPAGLQKAIRQVFNIPEPQGDQAGVASWADYRGDDDADRS